MITEKEYLEKLILDLDRTYNEDKDNKFEYWRGFAALADTISKSLKSRLLEIENGCLCR